MVFAWNESGFNGLSECHLKALNFLESFSDLAILSIEPELVDKIGFDKNIDSFAIQKMNLCIILVSTKIKTDCFEARSLLLLFGVLFCFLQDFKMDSAPVIKTLATPLI